MNIYWRIGSYLIAIGAVLFGLWWYGDTRYDEGYAARNSLQLKVDKIATDKAREVEQGWQDKVNAATKEGAERANKLSTDAINSRNAANRLRNDLTEFQRKLPELTREAVNNYANAASIVFGECASEYSTLAEVAGRIDSDRQTLEAAWPK